MLIKSIVASLAVLSLSAGAALGQDQPPANCTTDASPYRDFDFVIGEWDFFMPDGTQVGTQTYSVRSGGCLILEEWTELSGAIGTGMTFLDPDSGEWHQVWMSERFHIDYSGGLDETGAMVLEGMMYMNAGGGSAPVRGAWTPQNDGSVRQEFWRYNAQSDAWQSFFVGIARPAGAVSNTE